MTKKVIVIGILGLIAVAVFVAYYQYNKPREDVNQTPADYRLTASVLFDEFLNEETEANKKYLDAIIVVDGRVLERIEDTEAPALLIGENGASIYCAFDILPNVKVGDMIRVKGRCSGFLMDVVLNECVLIKQNSDD